MSKVSFECNDRTVGLFIDILGKLEDATANRKIRIGGSEYDFYHSIDSGIEKIAVDDIEWDGMTSSEQLDIAVTRNGAISSYLRDLNAPQDDAEVDAEVEDTDADDEEEEEVACLECGGYGTPSSMDAEGLCPDCSEESEPTSTNLSDYAIQKVEEEMNESVRMSRIFTAFDITKKIRVDGVRCKHEDVKQIVHNTFLNGDMTNYGRTLIDVGTAIQPWLYCPVSRDPDDYNHGDN